MSVAELRSHIRPQSQTHLVSAPFPKDKCATPWSTAASESTVQGLQRWAPPGRSPRHEGGRTAQTPHKSMYNTWAHFSVCGTRNAGIRAARPSTQNLYRRFIQMSRHLRRRGSVPSQTAFPLLSGQPFYKGEKV